MHQAQPPSCYLCPLCAVPLQLKQKSYVCANNHHFDLAKEGYLNLLPVQFKHSSEPGDNKQMMQARRAFLEAGHYEPMAKAAAMMIAASQPEQLLDLGSGEGYYSRQLEAFCPHTMSLHGVDIAKYAIAAAAKKQANARFIVASANRLPYPDQFFDAVLRIFAPSNDAELARVLKPSGLLLAVTPGPRHLWQLKQFIYAEVREHALENPLPPGFERLDTQRISYKITPNPQQRLALLHMTPFAWRANEQVQQAIEKANDFEIETDFMLTLAIKSV
ncbi:MAG: 23S rRNA (guanine(745)-N(1))-methyltransferase [Methylobacter sp.]|nr:23S rRNA (guanine(745)-N(1))-methyltransferase [Methylobacter sp.]MDP2100395.1 23S rRNA (guanine(745)-N(1))-methyltransferase [Methylobacter sp.]MDP2427881.1 23S rRNA (guanine(745)-N(1))-methyltransferase [Methylobacter sp.]MDP3053867.1 23S rRNA (guanine(745)-N(1))-methyltransferase [Methylobacter sp.]MDP3363571.1 23S rRNA (guanine(745)-N(1))-methyltransferase [Methylobacter sp.]